jgi:hypothetical protein
MNKLLLTIILISLIVLEVGGFFFSLNIQKNEPDTNLKINCKSEYALACDTSQYARVSYADGKMMIGKDVIYTKDQLVDLGVYYYVTRLKEPFQMNQNYSCLDIRIEKNISQQIVSANGVEYIQNANNNIHAKDCGNIDEIDGLGVQKTNLLNYAERYKNL